MMARRSPAGPGSMMQLLLVRFLLMAVLLLAMLDAEVAAGSVRTMARQTTAASVVEDDDSSSSSAVSDELLEDESFEQDTAGGEKQSWPESESTTVQSEADADAMNSVVTGTTLGYSAVATTPKIVRPVKQLSRGELPAIRRSQCCKHDTDT
uniref:Secreted protein n=1 Tax=Anopheles maculatus TaxID=74869 RepID=A0A182T0B1_9DIPT